MVTGRIERSRQQQAMKGPCYRVAIIYSAFHEAGKEVGPKPAAVTGVEHRAVCPHGAVVRGRHLLAGPPSPPHGTAR